MPDYKVTDTQEIKQMTPSGAQTTVYRVWLTTTRGARGTLDVPPDQWNAETLPDLLSAKANELNLAFALSG